MGRAGYSLLTTEQEQVLKQELDYWWNLKNIQGDPMWSAMQIATALGFGSEDPSHPYAHIDPHRIYHYRHKFGLPKRHHHIRYEHRYKYGKQEELLDLDQAIKAIDTITTGSWNGKRKQAGASLSFWGGARNSENRMLIRDDFEYDEDMEGNELLRINLFRLKKGTSITRQDATYPIELRADWMFVPYIINWIERFKGKERPFNCHSITWWRWHKDVFGDQFYPHWLRLNRITFFCSDPRFSIAEIRTFTGLNLLTIDHYISKSRRFTLSATEKMNTFMFERN